MLDNQGLRAAEAVRYLVNHNGGQIRCTIAQGRIFITNAAGEQLATCDADMNGRWWPADLDRALEVARGI